MASLAMADILAASFEADSAAPSLLMPFTMPFIKCIACMHRDRATEGWMER
jgi:hypothetical protein